MLFTAWLPRLASVREYTGRFSYKDAFSYICERARQELGTGTLASREKFIAALEEWEVSNSVKEV